MPRYFTLSSIGTSLHGSIRAVSLHPKAFFAEMRSAANYRDSIAFLLLLLFVPSLIDSYLISSEKMHTIFPVMEGVGLLLAWLWAGYLYWCVKLFTKNALEHPAAFQISVYSSVPLLLDVSVWLIVPAYCWQIAITWKGLVNYVGLSHSIASWFMAIPVIMLLAAVIAFVMLAALSGVDLISPLLEENYVQKPYR